MVAFVNGYQIMSGKETVHGSDERNMCLFCSVHVLCLLASGRQIHRVDGDTRVHQSERGQLKIIPRALGLLQQMDA